MPQWTTVGRLAFYLILACMCTFSQEPYEDRAARLQPQDIPPLIEKAEAGDLPSQVLLWRAYSGGHGVTKDAKKGLPYLRMAAERGSLESKWVLSTLYEFGQVGTYPSCGILQVLAQRRKARTSGSAAQRRDCLSLRHGSNKR